MDNSLHAGGTLRSGEHIAHLYNDHVLPHGEIEKIKSSLNLSVKVRFEDWYEVLIQKMGSALQEAINAGMPGKLAGDVLKDSLSNTLKHALVIGTVTDEQDAMSIEDRIRAAVNEGAVYQVVHYMRGEGASSAIRKIAKERKGVILVADKMGDWKRWGDGWLDKVVIVDALPEDEARRWRNLVGIKNRVIYVKPSKTSTS
ncbi:hypothetical protein [Paenibacillus campinasensis]|uniref:Uncharacterized protein n=1 Tax=Paenibacillus campinasensis TaxID=66347 RepID=A0A268EKN4_9BACL|nr:hypothetical protein [Paenibacillus campinasensis]PAD73681.1 hypothetical protein CHH67_19800 [Paenibacillus campinasensis]